MDRNEAIQRIRAGLRKRSGKAWSVTGGRVTAWGWIEIDAPPAERTWRHRLIEGSRDDYEEFDSGQRGGCMSPKRREELAALLGKDKIHPQGERIPASTAYYVEYVDRAEGRAPSQFGTVYWD